MLRIVFNIIRYYYTAIKNKIDGGVKGELFSGYRVSVFQDRKVLESCLTTMWMHLASLNHAPKRSSDGLKKS